jgi:hypothetical protein
MAGLIGNAPIYVNGLLSLLFVFVLPGLACASLLRIPDFPQRWFAVFLSSLIANHALVTLIAAFHLDPLLTYRIVACVVVVVPVVAMIVRRSRPASSPERSTLSASDLGWFAASLVALAITYFNVWKHGVPNIFIVAFAPFRSQIQTYFHTLPLDDSLTSGLNNSTGCTAVLYPLDRIHPSIQNFISDHARSRGLQKVLESNGMELLLSRQ